MRLQTSVTLNMSQKTKKETTLVMDTVDHYNWLTPQIQASGCLVDIKVQVRHTYIEHVRRKASKRLYSLTKRNQKESSHQLQSRDEFESLKRRSPIGHR